MEMVETKTIKGLYLCYLKVNYVLSFKTSQAEVKAFFAVDTGLPKVVASSTNQRLYSRLGVA